MRVLVFGRAGQLARALGERAAGRGRYELVFAGRPKVDLEKPATIEAAVDAARPDLVINAAAYTAVDAAERDVETARTVNGRAPGFIAAAAHRVGARMIQVSTDYVFDGRKGGAYVETDAPNPLSVYGATKREGETAALAEGATVVRTAWVYGPFGRNFVLTMLDLAKIRSEIEVVDDQRGSPTSALDLSDALLSIGARLRRGGGLGRGETYHVAGAGRASRADLARAVFRVSRAMGGPFAAVKNVGSDRYPSAAERPRDSTLDCRKAAVDFGVGLARWEESAEMVTRMALAGKTR